MGLLIISCSTTHLVDNWKNPEIDTYEPTKVLVVGITSNIEAREIFEQQLKGELEARGIVAITSLDFFNPTVETEKMTEEDLKTLEGKLIIDGFDTILLTKVVGVEDKIIYKKEYDDFDNTYRKFNEEYLMYQDIFYNPDYYENYTVYNTETSMYCICPTKERELIWKGYIDIVDPILDNTDLVLLDLKHMVEEKSKDLTGFGIEKSLKLAKHLDERNIPVWIRHVLVPGVTDDFENLEKLGQFASSLNNVERFELLPYHTLGVNKWESMDIDYELKDVENASSEDIEKAVKIIEKFGVNVFNKSK